MTTFYGLYFSHQCTNITNYISSVGSFSFFSGNKTLDQHSDANKKKQIFGKFCVKFLAFFIFFCSNTLKSIFWPAFGVRSNQTLVEIYNKHLKRWFQPVNSMGSTHLLIQIHTISIASPFFQIVLCWSKYTTVLHNLVLIFPMCQLFFEKGSELFNAIWKVPQIKKNKKNFSMQKWPF